MTPANLGVVFGRKLVTVSILAKALANLPFLQQRYYSQSTLAESLQTWDSRLNWWS